MIKTFKGKKRIKKSDKSQSSRSNFSAHISESSIQNLFPSCAPLVEKNRVTFCKFVRGVVAFGGSVQFVENCTYLSGSTRPSEVPVVEPQRLSVGLCEQNKEDNRLWQWRQFRVFGSLSITGGSGESLTFPSPYPS